MASESSPRLPLPPSAPPPAVKTGFDIRITGIGLPDLIQVKCLSGVSECLRVVAGSNSGTLIFGGGQLTHAQAGSLLGDAAVMEMLNWGAGACQPSTTPLGPGAAVKGPWQHLLLAAAKAVDERARFKQQGQPAKRGEEATMDTSRPEDDEKTPTLVRIHATTVKQDAHGHIVAAMGDAEDLASATAYLLHVAEYIGAAMGLDPFRGGELRAGDLRTVVATEDGGGSIAVQSRDEQDVAELRGRAGL